MRRDAVDAEPRLRDAARLRFATDRLPWQRSLRWTRPPRDRRLLALGLLIAIAFTIVELVGFGLGMRGQIARETPPPRPKTVEVVLIEPPPVLPMPPEPEPPSFERRPSRVRVEAPKVELPPPPQPAEEDTGAMRARIGDSGTAAPRLFNPDGSIRLAAPTAAPKTPANPQEAAKQRWAEIEKRGENPLDCKRTRFAQAFKPDESLGDEVSRKYLKWIGLGDGEAIAHRAEQREKRAAEGCDPVK
ncbi:MAG TPA: hypothetical protein VJ696_00825 [Rhodanobacteraceae bacterium]|nr:hypothetical protein [Rhodanobacteraceae bacterium]